MLLVPKGFRVFRVPRAIKVTKVRKVPKVLRVYKGKLVRVSLFWVHWPPKTISPPDSSKWVKVISSKVTSGVGPETVSKTSVLLNV